MSSVKQDFIAFMHDENMFDVDWASSFRRADYSMQKKMAAVMADVADCVVYDTPDWRFVGRTSHLFGTRYAFHIQNIGMVTLDNIPLMRTVPMAIVQLSDMARVLVSNDVVMNEYMEPAPTREICGYAGLMTAVGDQHMLRGMDVPKLAMVRPYAAAAAARMRALKDFLKNYTK